MFRALPSGPTVQGGANPAWRQRRRLEAHVHTWEAAGGHEPQGRSRQRVGDRVAGCQAHDAGVPSSERPSSRIVA